MPNPPAFETSATSSGVVALPMGAWMIGASIPKTSHSLVLTVAPFLRHPRVTGWLAHRRTLPLRNL